MSASGCPLGKVLGLAQALALWLPLQQPLDLVLHLAIYVTQAQPLPAYLGPTAPYDHPISSGTSPGCRVAAALETTARQCTVWR